MTYDLEDWKGTHYVYYERFGKDFPQHSRIAESVDRRFKMDVDEGSNALQIAAYFRSLYQTEVKKEIALLEQKFGRTISGSYDIENSNLGVELIQAFNTILSTKQIFERNYKLITQTQGQKGLFTWFAGYFDRIWKRNLTTIESRLANAYTEGKDVLRQETQILMADLVRETLIEMMTKTKSENGLNTADQQKLKDAYAELAKPLQDLNNAHGNQFIQSFIQTYHLNELADVLLNTITDNQSKSLDSINLTSQVNIHSTGGEAMEHLGTYMANTVASLLVGPNISVQAFGTGAKEMKADTVIAINLPTDTIKNWLDNSSFGTRPKDLAAIRDLEQQLQGFNDGFIIYSNAKNYTLNANFHGFSAGQPMSLRTLDAMGTQLGTNADNLIFATLQTMKGARGEDRIDEINAMFMRTISAALFDDVQVQGLEQSSSPSSIHVLFLNGVYFPISFYYKLLSDAFQEYGDATLTNPRALSSLIKVEINQPTIAFNFGAGPDAWVEGMKSWTSSQSPWAYQREQGLDTIKVSYYFLQGLKTLFKQLNLNFE